MKNQSIIIVCLLLAMMSCTKSKEVHPEIGDGNDEIVTVCVKDVHVEYTRTDHAELNRVVFHYCPADANGNAQQFVAAEMTKKETFFELTLNDLLRDTLYWYYYELFPNSGDAFNTIQKTFRTQAYDAPEPPEPPTPPSGVPEGAIDGLFTVNDNGDKVRFSQGNLQYQASTNTWRFAEHQWDYVGDATNGTVYENGAKCDNTLISSSYDGWIDLYGWGTSGYDHGAVCYQPWSVSQTNSDYFAYGFTNFSLFDQTGLADWGYNAISNGGNHEGLWHTLTRDEINYIIYSRNTMSGVRYAKAQVNDVQGIILLPDDWTTSIYTLNNTDTESASYSSNIIDDSQWTTVFEPNGAVFMPVTCHRHGFSCSQDGCGIYWLATCTAGSSAYNIYFHEGGLIPDDDCGDLDLYAGRAVRLVQDANK